MQELISKELYLQRMTKKLNLKEAAVNTGVSVTTICSYETGKRSMKLDTILKIIKGYGIATNVFFEKIVANMEYDKKEKR